MLASCVVLDFKVFLVSSHQVTTNNLYWLRVPYVVDFDFELFSPYQVTENLHCLRVPCVVDFGDQLVTNRPVQP